MIFSPFDTEARNRTKRDVNWTGYLVHLTETCADGEPHFITDVQTTSCSVGDNSMTAKIHQTLKTKGLLPKEHWFDAGYVDAELLASSPKEYGVDPICPAPRDNSWQAHTADALGISQFIIDWDAQKVLCPEGHYSRDWRLGKRKGGQQSIQVHFSPAHCVPCPQHDRCTHADRRVLHIRPKEAFEALGAARVRQQTEAFRKKYRRRAGIEGTISQCVRSHELRHTRYVGTDKTHLQHLATATAINLARYVAWQRKLPLAPTRVSRFRALLPCSLT